VLVLARYGPLTRTRISQKIPKRIDLQCPAGHVCRSPLQSGTFRERLTSPWEKVRRRSPQRSRRMGSGSTDRLEARGRDDGGYSESFHPRSPGDKAGVRYGFILTGGHPRSSEHRSCSASEVCRPCAEDGRRRSAVFNSPDPIGTPSPETQSRPCLGLGRGDKLKPEFGSLLLEELDLLLAVSVLVVLVSSVDVFLAVFEHAVDQPG